MVETPPFNFINFDLTKEPSSTVPTPSFKIINIAEEHLPVSVKPMKKNYLPENIFKEHKENKKHDGVKCVNLSSNYSNKVLQPGFNSNDQSTHTAPKQSIQMPTIEEAQPFGIPHMPLPLFLNNFIEETSYINNSPSY